MTNPTITDSRTRAADQDLVPAQHEGAQNASQQKPLRPGSAEVSLTKVLGSDKPS